MEYLEIEGHISNIMICKTAKELDIKWKIYLPYNLQAAGFVERKNGILKQIKLLTGEATLVGWTKVLFNTFE